MVSSSPQRMVPYRSPSISLCSWQPEHQAAVAATPAFVKGVPGWLGREDPLEKEMVTNSSILAWRIPWTEEPGGLQFMGSQKIWKTQQWPQDWKSQFSFQSQRKAILKNAQTTAQLHYSHMLVKKCSKFSKPGFSNM